LIRNSAGYDAGIVLSEHGHGQQEGQDYEPDETISQVFSFGNSRRKTTPPEAIPTHVVLTNMVTGGCFLHPSVPGLKHSTKPPRGGSQNQLMQTLTEIKAHLQTF
jgi:hypothetical protein